MFDSLLPAPNNKIYQPIFFSTRLAQHVSQLIAMANSLRKKLYSIATIPLCLWEWKHEINKGDLIVFAASGGGFTWGATLVRWKY